MAVLWGKHWTRCWFIPNKSNSAKGRPGFKDRLSYTWISVVECLLNPNKATRPSSLLVGRSIKALSSLNWDAPALSRPVRHGALHYLPATVEGYPGWSFQKHQTLDLELGALAKYLRGCFNLPEGGHCSIVLCYRKGRHKTGRRGGALSI